MSHKSHEPLAEHGFSPWRWIAWTLALVLGLWVAIMAVHRHRMEKIRSEVESRGGRLEGEHFSPGWYEWLLAITPGGWPKEAVLKFKGNFQRVTIVHLPPATTPPHDLIARLNAFKQIRELSLPECQLTDDDLDGLSKLTSLRQLNLSGNAVTDRGLAQLANLSELRVLELFETRAAGHFLEHSSRWPELSSLRLSRSPVTGEGLARMGTLPNLRVLLLDHSHVSDLGLTSLAVQPELATLTLDASLITDQGLAAVDDRRFPKLQVLQVGQTAVTANGVSRLQSSGLARLMVPNLELSDEHWRELTRMKKLTLVRLDEVEYWRETKRGPTGGRIVLDSFIGMLPNQAGHRIWRMPRHTYLRVPKSPVPENRD